MDAESPKSPPSPEKRHMSRGLKRALTILNCIIMILGDTGGPMLSRLYFAKGGKRQWLSSWLQTGGWPLISIPLAASYLHRRRLAAGNGDPAATTAKPFLITLPIFAASAGLGILTGLDDFLYEYGLSFLPVSTSALLTSTQLCFTAFFAFLVVRQRFTPYSLNAVALLTVGAVVLGMHTSSDRPDGVSKAEYFKGFFLTIGACGLYGFVLPMVELVYARTKQAITYTLVMEMQLVIGFFATLFCTIGMLINHDFQAIPSEAQSYRLGEARYYVVLVWNLIFWQFFFLGTIGVIFCANTLLAGIIIAVFIPVNEVLGVIFFHEKFTSEKGISLALSLWGLASYSYGEYKAIQEKKAARADEKN